MSGKTILGVALIVIGALVLAYQGFTYTTHKKAVDVGPFQVNKTEHHAVFVPPVIGAIALVGGAAILLTSRRTP
jgi:drug/metabolite transporter (DMT)-like permease